MKINRVEKVIILLICISFCVGAVTVYQRVNIEKQYKTAEIVLDYNEMEKLSRESERDIGFWLSEFKKYGAESAAVQEETINLMIKSGKPLRAEIASELVKTYNWEQNYNDEIADKIHKGEISGADVIIATKDKAIYDYLTAGIKERYSDDFYDNYSLDGEYYIVLQGTMDDMYYGSLQRVVTSSGKGVDEYRYVLDSRLFNIGVGYDDSKINFVKSAGLDVVLRPINYSPDSEKLPAVYAAANEKYGLTPRLYFVHGKEVIGYPENTDKFTEVVNKYNIAPVLLESATQREHIEQDGMNKLVEKANYNSLRGFTMWDFIRARYKYYNYSGAEEIENTMFRAITERNIRAIYFKPFFTEEGSFKYITDAGEYEKTFATLKERLDRHNIKLGKASAIEEFHIGSKRLALLCFGITLAGVLLFIKMFNIKNKYFNLLYLGALPGAMVPLVMRGIAEKGFAILAAVAFSGLGIYYFMVNIKHILDSGKKYSNIQLMIKAAVILAISVAISLVGAVFVDSVLADVRYMLEMDIFRGVKISQLLPFGVYLVIYLIYFTIKDEESSLKSIANTTVSVLNKEIRVYYVIIAGLIGIAGYIYISRTGHETNMQPSTFEMISRNFMENVLLARPRTKEFLIAFPAIFAAVFAAGKKSEFLAGLSMLAAAMGTSSVINTFSHIRTPIYLSVSRTLIGLGFGIIIGCVLILVLDIIYKLNMKVRERLK